VAKHGAQVSTTGNVVVAAALCDGYKEHICDTVAHVVVAVFNEKKQDAVLVDTG
jgi:hypothetical protein